MTKLEQPNINVVHESGDHYKATIVVEPLERGFGITLGNSLRRVMLSSLQGAAATSIKIDGVVHELSTIKGVKEDVPEVVMNIKSIVARLNCDGSRLTIIDKVGPCEITAGDIEHDTDVEIVNPTQHIATVTSGAKFRMEIIFSHGHGYVTGERNKQIFCGRANNPTVGQIYVDSIYTPVKTVSYNVSPTRVENVTDYDKLTLDIETNGSVSAVDAMAEAANILIDQFGLFVTLSGHSVSKMPTVLQGDITTGSHENKYIDELGLSVRSFNCLKRADINTMGELLSHTESDMREMRNLGEKSFQEILAKVKELGLHFRPED